MKFPVPIQNRLSWKVEFGFWQFYIQNTSSLLQHCQFFPTISYYPSMIRQFGFFDHFSPELYLEFNVFQFRFYWLANLQFSQHILIFLMKTAKVGWNIFYSYFILLSIAYFFAFFSIQLFNFFFNFFDSFLFDKFW